jgi:spermidine export protein MdtJ
MAWIALAFAIVFNAAANVMIKVGVRHVSHPLPDAGPPLRRALQEPYLYFGVISFGAALAVYSLALTKLDLSIAYPLMTSLGLIFVAAASIILFGESFGATKTAGTVLIMAGITLVARG